MTGYITETRGGITMYASRSSARRAARRAEEAGDGNGIVVALCADDYVRSLDRPVTFTDQDQSIRDLCQAIEAEASRLDGRSQATAEWLDQMRRDRR